MSKSVFFSFQEGDRHYVAKIKGRAVNSRYPKLNFKVQDLLRRWNTETDSVIRQAITKSIKGTSRTIVFVGNDTHKSYWVKQEVELTMKMGKSVFAISLPERSFLSFDPDFLADNNIPIHSWSEEKLQFLATHEINRNMQRPKTFLEELFS